MSEETPFRSGFVHLVGRPNAGKSTLVNALVGAKVAITSRTAQTTRKALRAIVNGDGYQMVVVDTPGLHKPHDELGEELNRSALGTLADADEVVMVVDASAPLGRGDQWVARAIENFHGPRVLCLNKRDRVDAATLERQREAAEALLSWDGIYAVSARNHLGLEALCDGLVALLPPGPAWFPTTMASDAPLEETVAEIVREKVLRSFREEVPHATAALTRAMTFDERRSLWHISVSLIVERDSQKAMLIGHGGSAIKRVGTEARADLERLLGDRVFLELNVEVKKHWRRDLSSLQRFGYRAGGP